MDLTSQALPTSPYPSPGPLREADAERFYGRRRLTHRVLARVREPGRFLALVGPAGCGKTSLVQAGLLPALRKELGEALLVLHIEHPSLDAFAQLEQQGLVHPAEDLALAVRERARQSGARRVVVVLDHAEELLLLAPAAQRNLLDQLLTLTLASMAPETLLLWVARGDCLCALSALAPALTPLFEPATVLIPGTLELSEWTAMVKEPARRVGVTVEPGLIDELARDLAALTAGTVEQRPCEAVLPLLVATLQRLWENLQLRAGAVTLSVADYQGSAVLGRALAVTAESAWQSLPLRLQPMARRLLLLLVHPQPLAGGTLLLPHPRREEALIGELAPDSGVAGGAGQLAADAPARLALDTLTRLVAGGLVRREEGLILLAHAALLSEWKELARWPEEERRFAAWQRETMALLQRDGSRPSQPMLLSGASLPPGISSPLVTAGQGAVLYGAKLAEAERWLADRPGQLDPKLARLIAAGVAQRDRRAAQSVQLQPAVPRRWLWVLGFLGVLLIAGLIEQRQHQRARRYESYIELDSERGERATLLVQQPGQDGAALALAISAAAPSLRSGRKTPALAKDGLMLTYSAAKISRPLHGHTDSVERAVFDPSGQRILTGSLDQTARIWNARTGEQLLILSGHTAMLTAVHFSPDGTLVLTTSNDGTARIWDSQTGALRRLLKGHTGPIEMGNFSPLGDRVVTAGHDNTARIWDSRTGQELAVLRGHTDRVTVAEFLPSGRAVLTTSFDKTVRLWDSQTGVQLKLLVGHSHRVNVGAVSPDGERVVTGSWDETARLWNLGPTVLGGAAGSDPPATAALATPEPIVLPHGSPVHAVAFAPSGDYIATSGTDGVIKLWDGHTGALRARFLGHSGVVDGLGFSPNSQHVISAGYDRTVRLWDVRTEQNIAVLRGHSSNIYTATFGPTGAEAVTASYDKTARVWDVRSGTPVAILQGHTRAISSAVFSPDGTRIVTGGYDYTARLWRWPGGEPIATMTGHRHIINDVAFSPDGECIATSSTDADVRLWDGHTGRLLRVLSGHRGAVLALAFSPDNRRLVTGGNDGTLRSWDVATGRPLGTVAAHSGKVVWIEFAADGSLLVSSGTEGETYLRDPVTLQAQRSLPLHHTTVNSAVFQRSAAGLRLITASEDRSVRVWDPLTATQIYALQGFPDNILQATLSPAGTRMLIMGRDGVVRLWDMQAEMPLAVLPSFDDDLTTASYAPPDGRYFLIGSANGFVRIYADNYAANFAGTLTDACNLLRYQPEFERVRSFCP